MARIRLYDGGKKIGEAFAPRQIEREDILIFKNQWFRATGTNAADLIEPILESPVRLIDEEEAEA